MDVALQKNVEYNKHKKSYNRNVLYNHIQNQNFKIFDEFG